MLAHLLFISEISKDITGKKQGYILTIFPQLINHSIIKTIILYYKLSLNMQIWFYLIKFALICIIFQNTGQKQVENSCSIMLTY